MSHFFVHSDIRKAKTLTKDFYLSSDVFEASKHRIFNRTWQYMANNEVFHPGSNCIPVNLLPEFINEPLLLTRDSAGTIRCLPNVCTHRGNLLIYEACAGAHLRCRYHGRLFQLDGKMISMPEFAEVENFPSVEDNLPGLPLQTVGPLFFTNLTNAVDFGDYFGTMLNRISWMPLDQFRFAPEHSRNYFINANWALYCENYLEGFHIPFVHTDLNAVIDFGAYTTEIFRYSNLQLGIAKKGERCFTLPDSSPDAGKDVYAYYFWVFPNMMFNFYPWGLSLNVVQPLAVNRTKVSFLTFVWKDDLFDPSAVTDLDKVELEDEEVVQNVQLGLQSGYYQHGRYSPTREQGTHHFHRLLCEFMNTTA